MLQERVQILCAANANWSVSSEKHRMEQAFLATQYLHDLSSTLFKIRNEQEIPRSQARGQVQAQIAQPLDESNFEVFQFQPPSPFLSPKWDPKWLALVDHYFSLIRWPRGQASGPPISLLEVMVDLLITFQISTPVNKKNLRKKHGHSRHSSHLAWEHIKYTNLLPSKEETSLLPPHLLKECHSMWMHTIQYLLPQVNLYPHAQVTSRSLANIGYSNLLPSWPSRPLLLSGDAASRYLSSLIKPGARKLKYRFLLPEVNPRPLPPQISDMFN